MRHVGFLGGCLLILLAFAFNSHTVTTVSAAFPPQAGDDPFFLPQGIENIDKPYIQIDANNGVHVSYSSYTGGPAFYAYCATDCSEFDNWGYVEFSTISPSATDTIVTVTPDGKPRIVWLSSPLGSDDDIFYYGECDTDCLTLANWTVIPLPFTPDTYGGYGTRHFTLDPQGRPRFVYADYYDGTYYAYCDTTCATPSNWSQTLLSEESFYDVTLVFTSAGNPRITYYDTADFEQIRYGGCDTACIQPTNWTYRTILPRSSNTFELSSIALVLNSNDAPRLAYYAGDLGDSDPQSNLLFYGKCDTDCLGAGTWTLTQVPIAPKYGTEAEITLDSEDKPHFAYYIDTSPYALGYSVCMNACESATPTWEHSLLETSDQLDASDPVPPASPDCIYSFWYPGKNPSIAVDSNNAPYVVYEAEHLQSGATSNQCPVYTDRYLSRFITLADGGGSPGEMRQLYLPLTQR